MASLFDEHQLVQAFGRLAAAKSADQISASDARVLRDRLDQIVKDDEKRHSVEAVRAAKRERALNDPWMHPVLDQVNASLDRLGLSIEEAASLPKLNRALDDRRWSTDQRLRLKSMMAQVGIL